MPLADDGNRSLPANIINAILKKTVDAVLPATSTSVGTELPVGLMISSLIRSKLVWNNWIKPRAGSSAYLDIISTAMWLVNTVLAFVSHTIPLFPCLTSCPNTFPQNMRRDDACKVG